MTEDQLEQEALGWLSDVGYTCNCGAMHIKTIDFYTYSTLICIKK